MSYDAGCNGCCQGKGMLEAVHQQTVGAKQAVHSASSLCCTARAAMMLPRTVRECRTAQVAMGTATVRECWKQFLNKLWAPCKQSIQPARHVVRRRLRWVCYHGVGVLEAVSQQTVGAKGACHPASSPCRTAQAAMGVLPRCGSAGSSFPTNGGRQGSMPSCQLAMSYGAGCNGCATTVWEC